MKRRMMAGFVAVIAIAAVMMFSSYAGAEQLSAEEIKDTIFANATEINTYKFDMSTTMKMLIGNETGETEVTEIINGSGVTDLVNNSMMITMGMNTSIIKNTTARIVEIIEAEKGVYLCINNTMYTEVYLGIPALSALFHVMGSPEGYELWESNGLLNISEVELLEDVMVDDVNCSVLKIVPDTEKFWEIAINQSRTVAKLQSLPGFDNQSIMNISTTEWIAMDTGFPLKTQTTMRTMTRPDTEKEFTMIRDIEVELRFYDYNIPVSIESP